MISQEVGQGLPFWLPNGATIRRELERYIVDKELASGYQHVYTHHFCFCGAYKTSGHWGHYQEDMFSNNHGHGWRGRICSSSNELSTPSKSSNIMFTPTVNCQSVSRWNRYDAPLREICALTGLQRVRECSLNDGHPSLQNKSKKNSNVPFSWLSMFMKTSTWRNTASVSLSWPSRYSQVLWTTMMRKMPKPCFVQPLMKWALTTLVEGEAAFYGPKLIQVRTALGKEETLLSSLTCCQNARP